MKKMRELSRRNRGGGGGGGGSRSGSSNRLHMESRNLAKDADNHRETAVQGSASGSNSMLRA